MLFMQNSKNLSYYSILTGNYKSLHLASYSYFKNGISYRTPEALLRLLILTSLLLVSNNVVFALVAPVELLRFLDLI